MIAHRLCNKMVGTKKNLTDPTALAVRAALSSVRPTASYWYGLEEAGSVPPRNIVVFTRRSEVALRGGAAADPQHHRHVLLWVLETAGTVHVDGRAMRLHPGEGMMIFPFQTHFYQRLDRPELAWLFLTFESVEPAQWEPFRGRRLVPDGEDWGRIGEVVEEWNERASGIGFSLGRLLVSLLRGAARRPRKGAPEAARREVLERLNGLLQEPGFQNAGIDLLATRLGWSPGHLRARFRRECGMSLGRYLLQMRMNRAAWLLVHTRQRVAEVADDVGYESVFAFSRAFSRQMGMAPRYYRQRVG